MQSCPLSPERVSSKTSLNTFPLDRRMRTRRLQLFRSEIVCAGAPQMEAPLPLRNTLRKDRPASVHRPAVLYLWQHLHEVHCYPPERMVSIDVGKVE